MQSIFLSYRFGNEADDTLANQVEALVKSHGLQVVNGQNLAGRALDSEIQQRINDSDAVIALMTRRDRLQDGGWTTHDWVKRELDWARGGNKEAVALVEDGVTPPSWGNRFHWFPHSDNSVADSILILSDVIGQWKRESGRPLLIRVEPTDIAETACRSDSTLEYQLFDSRYSPSGWKPARVMRMPGAVCAQVDCDVDNCDIQLRLERNGEYWESDIERQFVMIQLKQRPI